jgi:hypothetical protein
LWLEQGRGVLKCGVLLGPFVLCKKCAVGGDSWLLLRNGVHMV